MPMNCTLYYCWEFDFKLQNELNNLSTRLEECSLQHPGEETPHSAQICFASVAVVTDADKQGEENTMMAFSREWVHGKTSLRNTQNTLFNLLLPELFSFNFSTLCI